MCVDHVNDYHAIHKRVDFLDATASCFHIMENSPRIAKRGDLRSWNDVNHYPVIRIYSPSDSILFLWYSVLHIRKQIPGKLRDSLAFWTNASRASTRLPPHPVNQGTQAAITWPNARYLRESPRESAKQTPRILGAWSSVCLLYIYIYTVICWLGSTEIIVSWIINNNSMPW